jgi:hypothetical protein
MARQGTRVGYVMPTARRPSLAALACAIRGLHCANAPRCMSQRLTVRYTATCCALVACGGREAKASTNRNCRQSGWWRSAPCCARDDASAVGCAIQDPRLDLDKLLSTWAAVFALQSFAGSAARVIVVIVVHVLTGSGAPRYVDYRSIVGVFAVLWKRGEECGHGAASV